MGCGLQKQLHSCWEQIDWNGSNLHVKRVKRGTPSTQPLYGDEIPALRKLQRDYPTSAYIFQSSRQGPLAKDTIAGIIERVGELALLPFPVHAICYAMLVGTLWLLRGYKELI